MCSSFVHLKSVTVLKRSQLNETIKYNNNNERANKRPSAHVIVDRGSRRFFLLLCWFCVFCNYVERLNISIMRKQITSIRFGHFLLCFNSFVRCALFVQVRAKKNKITLHCWQSEYWIFVLLFFIVNTTCLMCHHHQLKLTVVVLANCVEKVERRSVGGQTDER